VGLQEKSDEHGKELSTRVLDSDDSDVEEVSPEDQRRRAKVGRLH